MSKDVYKRFDIVYEQNTLLNETIILRDKETGVQYLFVQRGYSGGLTPLLDADGKPIINKSV